MPVSVLFGQCCPSTTNGHHVSKDLDQLLSYWLSLLPSTGVSVICGCMCLRVETNVCCLQATVVDRVSASQVCADAKQPEPMLEPVIQNQVSTLIRHAKLGTKLESYVVYQLLA